MQNPTPLITRSDMERLFRENQEDVERIRQITQKHKDPKQSPMNTIQNMLNICEDIYVNGSLIMYPHGPVIGQGERRNYYRGEREIYPSSQTTLWREVSNCKNEEQKIVVRMVAAMRIKEFCRLLKRTDYVQWWEGCDLKLDKFQQ